MNTAELNRGKLLGKQINLQDLPAKNRAQNDNQNNLFYYLLDLVLPNGM